MPRRVIDPRRPRCPVCAVPAVRHGQQDGIQMFTCQSCGVSGSAETFPANALARAAEECDEVCIPLPRMLDKPAVRARVMRCETCIWLAVCHQYERAGLAVQCEATGRVWIGATMVVV